MKSRFKEKIEGEVRDISFSEGVEIPSFVIRFPGYARSSFW
jgi:hypothetical protein